MMNLLAIFIGGGAGSLARYGVSVFLQHYAKTGFPLGTLTANVLSCIVLAVLTGCLLEKQAAGTGWRLLLLVGFCGGFSTFSAFSYETFYLIRTGHTGMALANVLVNVSLCLGVLFLLVRKAG